MARSYRKTPIGGWCGAPSDKPYKQQANRRYRRAVRMALWIGVALPDVREFFDVWNTPKDGKGYFGNCDPDVVEKLLRK